MDVFSTCERLMMRAPRLIKGTNGRIALRKSDFEAIGGYDERMELGWGFEDDDLIRRGTMAGIKKRIIPIKSSFLTAIQHADSDRIKFNKIPNKRLSRFSHKQISKESINRNEFVANSGTHWGKATVIKNFSDSITM
jgi:hypothetical protein